MRFRFLSFMLVWITTQAAPSFKHNPEIDLLDFMSRSNHLLQRNPSRTTACFDYFLPKLTELVEKYENENVLCSTKADEKREELEESNGESIKDLTERSNEACSNVKHCKETESAKSIFECYVDEGALSSKSFHSVSNDASVLLANLKELLRRIDSDEYLCFTENKIQYENDSAALYEELSKCIDGTNDIPTTVNPPVTTTEKEETTESTSTKPEEDTTESTSTKPEEDTTESTSTKPEEDTTESTSTNPEEDTTESTSTKPEEDTTESTSTKPEEDTSTTTTETPIKSNAETLGSFLGNPSAPFGHSYTAHSSSLHHPLSGINLYSDRADRKVANEELFTKLKHIFKFQI